MSFNTPAFLFFILPVCLLLYYAVDWRWKNLVALAASLVFFAWGQAFYLPLMLALIGLNFYLGQQIERRRAADAPSASAPGTGAKPFLLWGIALNLALLLFFKIVLA